MVATPVTTDIVVSDYFNQEPSMRGDPRGSRPLPMYPLLRQVFPLLQRNLRPLGKVFGRQSLEIDVGSAWICFARLTRLETAFLGGNGKAGSTAGTLANLFDSVIFNNGLGL
ncbi:hypothetical protein N657DRAFT_678923 [Parathielavia appendiculata]|uniref:Uncharacterized protein n=1 Tax=Parathielavia appendiculata TaxID=2587402 RepID=A0AAN6U4W7_9PEZI|nr:hypothetical protein N657DRAFT_678923 [Parathielavia appendiculata]